jgi:hypothetical protein
MALRVPFVIWISGDQTPAFPASEPRSRIRVMAGMAFGHEKVWRVL